MFLRYEDIFEHKVAVNEVKKVTRQIPNVKPMLTMHQKPHSYLWL
jgi:hypothetical protein